MKRRNFLKTLGAMSLPALPGMSAIAARPSIFSSLLAGGADNRVLVLIHLFGGNDGLNTVIPLDSYGTLHELRNNIILPEDKIIPLSLDTGLHPKMQAMGDLFFEGDLTILQNVGYADQNRSHFRSSDIWTAGSAADDEEQRGWIGRHLDRIHPSYPEGYPNAENPDPLTISIGNVAHATCQGKNINYSYNVLDPTSSSLLSPGGNTPLPEGYYGQEVAFLRETIGQANAYGNRIQEGAANGKNTVEYPADNPLAEQLQKVALMISGGLTTKVYTVYLGGFDTHANQASGDNTDGNHARQLRYVSEAIGAFQADLREQQLDDRVMGMTFSEFGRQIRSNGSRGTDHGDASPVFLFGNCVTGSIIGDSPKIDPDVDVTDGVEMKIDFRDIYGSILIDWFNVEEGTVRSLLYRGFQYMPLAQSCAPVLPVELLDFTARPVPDGKAVALDWATASEANNTGFDVLRSTAGGDFERVGFRPALDRQQGGRYDFLDTNVVGGQTYYYRLRQRDTDGSEQLSVIRSVVLAAAERGWHFGLPFPNPAVGQCSFSCQAPTSGMVDLRVVDTLGRTLLRDRRQVARGVSTLTLPLGRLPAGAYQLLLFPPGGQEKTARKLIIGGG